MRRTRTAPVTWTTSAFLPRRIRSSPLRMPKLTPSTAARIRWFAVKFVAEMPTSDARARGRSGVRSPFRNGKKVSPSAPGSVLFRASSISATLFPSSFTVSVTTLVAFMVQISGSHPPEEEQKGATLPVCPEPAVC